LHGGGSCFDTHSLLDNCLGDYPSSARHSLLRGGGSCFDAHSLLDNCLGNYPSSAWHFLFCVVVLALTPIPFWMIARAITLPLLGVLFCAVVVLASTLITPLWTITLAITLPLPGVLFCAVVVLALMPSWFFCSAFCFARCICKIKTHSAFSLSAYV
jgi:hypothetical protein